MQKKVFFIFILIVAFAVFIFFEKSFFQEQKQKFFEAISQKENTSTSTTSENISGSDGVVPTSTEAQIISEVYDAKNEIKNLSLENNAIISSPVMIEGDAKSNFFFEDQFSIRILDDAERIVGIGTAHSKEGSGDEEFIPFIATIDFNTPASDTGFILFEKENYNGVPGRVAAFRLPIQFSHKISSQISGGCRISGCSAQICSDTEVVTDCLYKEQYMCYQKATCERQPSGECGWTQTKELNLCLAQFE